mgnify:CR=1 FL=1|jgi:hypothetical protein
MKKETKCTKLMNIKKNYHSFSEFYNNEQHNIYLKLVETFEFSLKENIGKKLIVIAKINNITFDTTFEINKNNIDLLESIINPYFEKLNEFEICIRIRNLCYAFNHSISSV